MFIALTVVSLFAAGLAAYALTLKDDDDE